MTLCQSTMTLTFTDIHCIITSTARPPSLAFTRTGHGFKVITMLAVPQHHR